MEKFVARLRQEMNSSLHAIEDKCTADNEKTREAIPLLEDTLEKLRVFMCGYEFKDRQQEIDFFRIHKPTLLCYLLFYRKMHDIGINRPQGGSKVQKQYLHREQGRISAFFFRHREFYRYYRSGDTHFDCYYFLRGSKQETTPAGPVCRGHDPEFSSGGDLLVTHILANDMLDVYLEKELEKLEKPRDSSGLHHQANTGLVWTHSKTDLTEMIFPLFLVAAFNGGKLTRTEYRRRIENAFNIELGDFSRMLYDLKKRNNPTQFLDKLRKLLLDYLEEDEFKDKK
jgi:hypothetical protein